MDPKATAKSKRSHTQHGRKAHLPPAAIAHKKKSAAAAAAAAPSTHRGLPSNWDRYDDSNDEVDPNLAAKQSDDHVKPKSKGADFGYLVEQARSQPKDLGSLGSLGSSSVDDFPFDFMRGVSSLLAVRGDGILSRCQDDNFIVDDDTILGSEVPFLSMDLHALSAQLSKLKLSQRLFIEADLLPEELNVEEHATTTSAPTKLEISESEAGSDHGFNQQDFRNIPVLDNEDQTGVDSTFKANLGARAENDEPGISPVNSAELEEPSNSSKQMHQFGRREDEELEKTARFEAATAEAELDMLLDSFSETSLSGSVPVSLISKSPVCGSIVATSIDDSIDDLLAETSAMQQNQKYFPENSPLGSTSGNAHGSIDDLLAETSSPLGDQKHREDRKNKGTDSKVTDDFDSWLDTL